MVKMNIKCRLFIVTLLFLVRVVHSQNCSAILRIPLPTSKSEIVEQEHDDCGNGTNHCPPWYSPAKGGTCMFGSNIGGIVSNNPLTMQTKLLYFYCMTSTNLTGTKRDVVGGCLITPPSRYDETYFPLPCNVSELNHFICAQHNRDGQFCGKCRDGFALPVYSYSLTCRNCTNYSLNWLKYLGVAFGPLTVFSIFVSVFHISPTSPYLHGFIFTAHILSSPPIVRSIVNIPKTSTATMTYKLYFTLLSIWNLDFFRLVYKPFCIHPKVTVVQTLALDYIVAVYPLLLILATYLLVSLHDRNCKPLVCMWKPFKHVLITLMHNMNIQTSLIDSFATLFLLSAIKFQSVSFDLLFPTTVYHMDGTHDSNLYLYMAGDVEYFGPEHLPFALLAIFILLLFVIFPTLLLFLYPCRCFQRCLNALHCNSHTLRSFMDVFLGSYKDGTNSSRDLRYFAGVFFLARIVFIVIFTYMEFHFAIALAGILFCFLLFFLAMFHPQTLHSQYVVDSSFLCFLVVLVVSMAGSYHYHTDKSSPQSSVFNLITDAVLAPPLIYVTGLVVYWLLMKKKLAQKLFHKITSNIRKCCHHLRSNEENTFLVDVS